MRLLLIDTCGATASAAFADTQRQPQIRAAVTLPGRTASERLIAIIRSLSADHAFPLATLDAIVVVNGPGSFTGVRIGISAAKGLCESLGLPLIAISRLALLETIAPLSSAATRFTLLDAGRSEFYLRVTPGDGMQVESLVTRDQLAAAIDVAGLHTGADQALPTLVICEAALAESLSTFKLLLVREPTAADALPLALLRVETSDFDDIASTDANYLRRSDAEIFAKFATSAASVSVP